MSFGVFALVCEDRRGRASLHCYVEFLERKA